MDDDERSRSFTIIRLTFQVRKVMCGMGWWWWWPLGLYILSAPVPVLSSDLGLTKMAKVLCSMLNEVLNISRDDLGWAVGWAVEDYIMDLNNLSKCGLTLAL